jgi:putative membrane protein (TIGR04086 family)
MIIGIVTAMVLSILSAAVSAVFVDNESIKIGAIPYISFLVWVISSLLCAFISGRTGEGSLLLRCGIAVGIYYCILLCIGIVAFDGLNGNVLYGLVGCFLGLVIAIIVISKTHRVPVSRKIHNIKMK